MSLSHTSIGIGIFVFLGSTVSQAWLPDPAFMSVKNVTFDGGMVTADRVVRQEMDAGWQVVIKRKGEYTPVCITEADAANGIGWSTYSPDDKQPQSFTVDEWVGQDGCALRVAQSGSYEAYHSWTPQDGSKTVLYVAEFEVK